MNCGSVICPSAGVSTVGALVKMQNETHCGRTGLETWVVVPPGCVSHYSLFNGGQLSVPQMKG